MDKEDQQALNEVRTRLQRPNESYLIITAEDIKALFGNFITKEAE